MSVVGIARKLFLRSPVYRYGWHRYGLLKHMMAWGALLAYALRDLRRRFDKRVRKAERKKPVCDIVFIYERKAENWILGGIAREMAKYWGGKCATYYVGDPGLPRARVYFFCHFSHIPRVTLDNPWLNLRNAVAFFTHPKESFHPLNPNYWWLKWCRHVVCMSSQSVHDLAQSGIRNTSFSVGGADPAIFKPHARTGQGAVGFCCAFHLRKSPYLLFEIVKNMPHRNFILLGRHWKSFEKFEEMKALPNLEYAEASYKEYPGYYARMDVFASVSNLEGGPIPLLEAMMCNIVPVVSDTGFARDAVRHGENGFIFPVDANAEEVCALIEQAYALQADTGRDALAFTWQAFTHHIRDAAAAIK